MKTCNDLINYMKQLQKDYENELNDRNLGEYKTILGDLTGLIEKMEAEAKETGNDRQKVVSILENEFKKEIGKEAIKDIEHTFSYSNSFGLYAKERLKGSNPYPRILAIALKTIYDKANVTPADIDLVLAIFKVHPGFYELPKAKL
jgi:RNA-splicing ligase RtcB